MGLLIAADIIKKLNNQNAGAEDEIMLRADRLLRVEAVGRGVKAGASSIFKASFWKASWDYLTAKTRDREAARAQFHDTIGLNGIGDEDLHVLYRQAIADYIEAHDVSDDILSQEERDYLDTAEETFLPRTRPEFTDHYID